MEKLEWEEFQFENMIYLGIGKVRKQAKHSHGLNLQVGWLNSRF